MPLKGSLKAKQQGCLAATNIDASNEETCMPKQSPELSLLV